MKSYPDFESELINVIDSQLNQTQTTTNQTAIINGSNDVVVADDGNFHPRHQLHHHHQYQQQQQQQHPHSHLQHQQQTPGPIDGLYSQTQHYNEQWISGRSTNDGSSEINQITSNLDNRTPILQQPKQSRELINEANSFTIDLQQQRMERSRVPLSGLISTNNQTASSSHATTFGRHSVNEFHPPQSILSPPISSDGRDLNPIPFGSVSSQQHQSYHGNSQYRQQNLHNHRQTYRTYSDQSLQSFALQQQQQKFAQQGSRYRSHSSFPHRRLPIPKQTRFHNEW